MDTLPEALDRSDPKPKPTVNNPPIAGERSWFNEGFALHQEGHLAEAQEMYLHVLNVQPTHFGALHLLGVIAHQTGNHQRAVELINKAIEIDPGDAAPYSNRGNALSALTRHQAAMASYGKAIVLKPDYAQAYNNKGNVLTALNRRQQASDSYNKAIALNPNYPQAYSNRGNVLSALAQHQEAIDSYEVAIALRPDYAEAYSNRGAAQTHLKRHQEAISSFDKAIVLRPDDLEAYNRRGIGMNDLERHREAIDSFNKVIALNPDYADAYNNCAIALNDLAQHREAISTYEKAIALKPDYPEAYSNRGAALNDLARSEQAIASYVKAIALKPDYADAYNNNGVALHDLRRHQEAVDSCDMAIVFKPAYPEAYSNRGTALRELKRTREAIDSYSKAVVLKPDYAHAYNNRGNALNDLKQHQAAIYSYEKAIAVKPDYEFLRGMLVHTKLTICDWRDLASQVSALLEQIQNNERVTPVLPVLSFTASLSLQRKAAEIWVNDKHPANCSLGDILKRPRVNKIRIGYYSADFKNHAVSLLTSKLFETHSRDFFETHAFSFGQDPRDEMRLRLETVFDKFFDVKSRSDEEIAKLSREIGIDIAVDLGGLTNDSRPGIFALRSAPVQVNYLGYPGTMGATYMDYIIADRQVIPEETRTDYAEKVVYLPCFQANDSSRQIPERTYTRQQLGLPETGFVFCCFNNNHKLTPDTFDGWIRILKQVTDSVLFLYADSEITVTNLKQEAMRRGLEANRLVFGQRMSTPEYLARYRCADLFLDTYPFNGGTTVSDSLWAGLPVLTCAGEAFSSRMASSLVSAIGLSELITSTQADYEALAVELATNHGRLKNIKQKLERNRLGTPLFDTKLFTRHIEEAYTRMYERYQADLPPEHIDVAMQMRDAAT